MKANGSKSRNLDSNSKKSSYSPSKRYAVPGTVNLNTL